MTVTKTAARKLAQELKARNEQGESWRAIAESYGNPIIKRGTLNRIALSGGEYLPKDREILVALGLVEAKKPEPEHTRRIKRKIAKMAKDMKNPEGYQEPDAPEVETRMGKVTKYLK